MPESLSLTVAGPLGKVTRLERGLPEQGWRRTVAERAQVDAGIAPRRPPARRSNGPPARPRIAFDQQCAWRPRSIRRYHTWTGQATRAAPRETRCVKIALLLQVILWAAAGDERPACPTRDAVAQALSPALGTKTSGTLPADVQITDAGDAFEVAVRGQVQRYPDPGAGLRRTRAHRGGLRRAGAEPAGATGRARAGAGTDRAAPAAARRHRDHSRRRRSTRRWPGGPTRPRAAAAPRPAEPRSAPRRACRSDAGRWGSRRRPARCPAPRAPSARCAFASNGFRAAWRRRSAGTRARASSWSARWAFR